MSSLQRHIAAVTDVRLSAVTDSAASLIAQLRELDLLRERVKKAKLSARKSRRINRRKRTRDQ
jgi:hypothetical protein